MNDFKVGDSAYYIYMDMLGVSPEDLTLGEVEITQKHNMEHLNNGGYGWFKTKQDCIDAFKKRLDEL